MRDFVLSSKVNKAKERSLIFVTFQTISCISYIYIFCTCIFKSIKRQIDEQDYLFLLFLLIHGGMNIYVSSSRANNQNYIKGGMFFLVASGLFLRAAILSTVYIAEIKKLLWWLFIVNLLFSISTLRKYK